MNHLQTWIIVLLPLNLVFTSPIYTPTFVSGDIGRIIKNFPCISPRTGETGVCMFAATCERANGTHLSTCIDRFYFGSCCKLHDKPKDRHPEENTMKVEFTPSPLTTTDSAIENNYIPDDVANPKPIMENVTVSSTASTSSHEINMMTSRPFDSAQTKQSTTINNNSQDISNTITTESLHQGSSSTTAISESSFGTENTKFVNLHASSPKPSCNNSEGTKSPTVTETIVTTKKPLISSTSKPLSTIIERIKPSTRFPSRNATTMRPIQTSLSDSLEMFSVTKTNARPQQQTTNEAAYSSSSSTLDTTPSSNEESTLSIVSMVFNGTISTNEILKPDKLTTVVTTENNILSTLSPGLVTWSSYVNNQATKAPEIFTTTTTTTQQAKPANSASTTLGSTIPTNSSTTVGDGNDAVLFIPTENFNMSDYKQICGTRLLPDSRIVGGGPSTFGKWPWQLSLQRWNISSSAFEHSCGAVLLTNNWAITAAHCVEAVPWKYLLMIIGDHDMKTTDEPYETQQRRVQFVFSHPQFDQPTFEYDVAVLRFDKPLATFQPNILPICLPDNDEYFVGQSAFVTGWGRLYHNGRVPSVLRQVSVPVISNALCEKMYERAGYKERIPNIFICAGRRQGGIDSCEGDSGGPMVIQRASDGRWILAGIISWGIGCGASNQPGVYTRISEFRQWIAQSIKLIDEAYIEAEALL